ncbi:hypothetical protein [Gracilimonas sp. BCB1]|uniref:hypothetical protein n=1 Tax=Gracilimonas sp. BCB1 TaxID=3152362 RepID=UPI0032D9006D
MENLEQLKERILAHSTAEPMAKLLFAVAPAVELGIRNIIAEVEDREEPPQFDRVTFLLMLDRLESILLESNELMPEAEFLLNGVGHARSLSVAKHIHERWGVMEEEVQIREETIQNANEYLDRASLFIDNLIKLRNELKS